MRRRKQYPTDLADTEYEVIGPLLPQAKWKSPAGGRPFDYDRREILNGIRYVLRSGCAWRLMPHDLPSWRICYHYFRQWRLDGTWKRIHDRLHGDVRESMGRERQPSAAVIDSQSVKTTERGARTVTMRAKRSMVASDTSWSTRSGC
ncbi:MAG TPA: transposase [Chloroflexota bacterium]|nr:transposase [Chloroflexota bacterium]